MWPSVTYETHPWERDFDELALIPKSRRRKITATYEAAIPAKIASKSPALSSHILQRISELRSDIARFDQDQKSRDYDLPALLLRSESSSSSQIENLTSSVRNVALAELSGKTPANARLIAANVTAMRTALLQAGPLDVEAIVSVHSVLMADADAQPGIRTEQVWVGGTAYSPHGALFVPPAADRVHECLEDALEFSARQDIEPVAKAAIFHAQFETIHPFTDGNGRTGRALIHRMLADDEVLSHATLPVSAGLLHDVSAYMAALDAYHQGDICSIVDRLADALELAIVLGARIAGELDQVLEGWRVSITDRAGSASHRLPALLVEQPVVNTAFVAERLGITDRAARTLVETACERGILEKMGNAKRGAFYQASDLIAVLEEASSVKGIRRMASR